MSEAWGDDFFNQLYRESLRYKSGNYEPTEKPCVVLKSDTNRGKEWCEFAAKVLEHIDTYVVPQYLDAPNDQAETFTAEDCNKQISRYTNRFGQNSREGQELLDPLKIGHYSALLYFKQKKELEDNPVLPDVDIYQTIAQVLQESDVTEQEMEDLVTLFKLNRG